MIKTVGARELKMRLGGYLRQAREGTVIIVTERGVPVAELRALSEPAAAERARLERMADQGRASWISRGGLEPFERVELAGGPPLFETIAEERDDRG